MSPERAVPQVAGGALTVIVVVVVACRNDARTG
jgi:hypothetical protein